MSQPQDWSMGVIFDVDHDLGVPHLTLTPEPPRPQKLTLIPYRAEQTCQVSSQATWVRRTPFTGHTSTRDR